MLAEMSLKVAAILGRRGFQHEFTEGPLCWMFISGLSMEMAACSRRLSCPLVSDEVMMLVDFQLILWPFSFPCLAGALLMLPVESSV